MTIVHPDIETELPNASSGPLSGLLGRIAESNPVAHFAIRLPLIAFTRRFDDSGAARVSSDAITIRLAPLIPHTMRWGNNMSMSSATSKCDQ